MQMDLDSDVDYWSSAHTGFDFSENDTSSGGAKLLTSARKKEDYQLLNCNGLIEGTEERNSSVGLNSYVLWIEDEKHIQKLPEKYNPFEFSLKETYETVKLTASQTVKNMVLGLNYSLLPFKGKESKIELLKAAVKSHDGNTILTVLLFLKSTLKKSMFQRELSMYHDVVNIYLSYLEEDHEIDELTNMFLLLDKPDDAAMVKYNTVLSLENPDRKIKCIDNCLNTHFQTNAVDDFLHASAIEHKQLLRDQTAIEDFKLVTNPDDEDIFKCFQQLTNERKLVDTSVMSSLVFCNLFFYNAKEATYMSPVYTKNTYQLSRKQFLWGTFRALAATKRWQELEDLFTTKNWLGGVKIKSDINVSQVIHLLFKIQAPQEVMYKFVNCVENQDLKLSLAMQYQCHSVVIEIYKNSRNRVGLINYKSTLLPHSIHFCTVADILNDKAIKWRN